MLHPSSLPGNREASGDSGASGSPLRAVCCGGEADLVADASRSGPPASATPPIMPFLLSPATPCSSASSAVEDDGERDAPSPPRHGPPTACLRRCRAVQDREPARAFRGLFDEKESHRLTDRDARSRVPAARRTGWPEWSLCTGAVKDAHQGARIG